MATPSNHKDWAGTSVRDRIEEIVSARGFGWNELARLAEINPGTLVRLGKRTKKPDTETLRKIADVTHVSFEWLAFGRGRPDLGPPGSGEVERFPNRAEAARITRDGGLDEAPIQAVLGDPHTHLTKDPSILWWIHQIEARALLGAVSDAPVPPRQPTPTPVSESVRRPRKRARVEK